MDRDIYHIASDYFSDRITASDREYLNAWLDKSPDNKIILAELEKVWKLTGHLQRNLTPDVNAEWTRFLQNRDQANEISKPHIKKTPLWANPMFRIAAVFVPVLLVITSLVFVFLKSSDEGEWLTITAGDTPVEQILPDGSNVWINLHGSLSYPKHFKDNERQVKLSGEGFFNVVKHKGIFLIEAGSSEIRVLGTQFSVRTYIGKQITEVLVKEGKVSFSARNNKSINVILTKGEKGILDANEIRKKTNPESNPFAWVTRRLDFDHTSISQMGNDVARYFNKTVMVSPSLQPITFTGSFTNPQLEEVLRVLSISVNCNYQIKNDTIFIRAK